jgi:pyruvate,water dikinase
LILTGTPGCEKIGVGKPHIILKTAEQHLFKDDEVLVLTTATPAHDPLMRISAATVTDRGGVTCHAAIVGREMGKPVVVGTTKATKILGQYDRITVDGTTGKIYNGELKYTVRRWDTSKISPAPYKIMINVGKAEEARKHGEKSQGIGLMRIELIYAGFGWHPLFLKHYKEFVGLYEQTKNKGGKTFEFFGHKIRLRKAEKLIEGLEKATPGYKNKIKALKDHLAHEMASAAMAVYPYDAIIRFSDFKSNEYRDLKGGEFFETLESNPMQGFRGARRYVSKSFREVFKKTEIEAARDAIFVKGADNIKMMIPIVSQVSEVTKLQKMMDKIFPEHRGLKGMFEVPVNAFMAKEFAEVLEYGFSIGSNDFTSGVLMIDRDSENKDVADIFNEHNPGVERGIQMGIEGVHMHEPPRDIGICGEGPSNNPPFRKFLVRAGIDSISVNPDVIGKVKKAVAKEVKQLKKIIKECHYDSMEVLLALTTPDVRISEANAKYLIKKLS